MLRATYPGLTIDRATFVGRRCAITCSDGSAMELIGTYGWRSAVLKADAGGRLQIGRRYVGPGSMVIAAERVDIGGLCQLAEYVVVRDQDHLEGHIPLDRNEFVTTPVAIGERIWIGAKATILRGVRIGEDAVIGAHALVTRPVPAGERWAGVPAQLLRREPGPSTSAE